MARSIVNQGLYLQREVTPGTAVTDAMRRYLGIQFRPGWNVQRESFRAEGYKVPTASVTHMATGQHSVTPLQDFNALLPILASVLTYDGATQPDPTNAPNAYEHTFHLEPDAADDLLTYTAIWGDSTQALQMAFLVFNALTFGVQRQQLTLSTNSISQAPTPGATVPATGVTEVASVPIAARAYDAFMDETWAALGTTKLLALYEASLTIGDKRTGDAAIDSTVDGFADLIENADIDFSGSMRAGFDSEAIDLHTAYQTGSQKFLRLAASGPEIGTGVPYEIAVDASVEVTNPGEIGEAPNSPVVTLPFDVSLMHDATSGNTLAVRLVNTVPSL